MSGARFAPRRLRIRTRIALWCAGLVVASGLIVLLGTLILVQKTLDEHAPKPPLRGYSTNVVVLRSEQFAAVEANRVLVEDTTAQVRTVALAGLAVFALLAVGIGWYVAGRMLRPAAELARATRQITASSLSRRVRADGPQDELRSLADSFDEMLDRLDRSFDRQRRFVSDVSHELRTPFAAMRAQVDVALDRERSSQDLRTALADVGEVVDRGTAMINAMLSLSQAEALGRREEVDLSGTVAEVVTAHPGTTKLRLVAEIDEGVSVVGDPVLLARLVENLVTNAIAYNTEHGLMYVGVSLDGDLATVTVANDGERIAESEAQLLLDRFRRGDHARPTAGFGLGLSIVAAIAAAHNAELTLDPRPDGGLRVSVAFRAAWSEV